jgi:prolyl-tRNA synthetase
LGLRDLENNVVEIARRDTGEKTSVSIDGLAAYVNQLLEQIQEFIFQKALAFRNENIRRVDTWDEFVQTLDEKAGFISAHWDGTSETEEKIKEKTKATIRCIPLNNSQEDGVCIFSGNPSKQRVLFARAY